MWESTKTMNILDQYQDEESCIKFLEKTRWKDGIYCPRCSSKKCYPLNEHLSEKYNSTYRYKCNVKGCNKRFHVLINTIWRQNRFPLVKWFGIIYYLSQNKKPNTEQLSKKIGRSPGTTRRRINFIRLHFTDQQLEDFFKKGLPATDALGQYQDEQSCINHLEKIVWQGNIVCPFCFSDSYYILNNNKNHAYKCGSSDCYKKFNVRINTIFYHSSVSLVKWFQIIHMLGQEQKNTVDIPKRVGITQRSAWRIVSVIERNMTKEQIRDFLNKDFSQKSSIMKIKDQYRDDAVCSDHLEKVLWKDGIKCRHCLSPHYWKTNCFSNGTKTYKCHNTLGCGSAFSIKTGSIFHNTTTPLIKWFYIIYKHEKFHDLSWQTIKNSLGLERRTAQRFIKLILESDVDYQVRDFFKKYPELNYEKNINHSIFSLYNDEEKCIKSLEKFVWPDGICCPNCKNTGYKIDGHVYRCTVCSRKYNAKAKSIFKNTRQPLNWFYKVLHLFYCDAIIPENISQILGTEPRCVNLIIMKAQKQMTEDQVKQILGIENKKLKQRTKSPRLEHIHEVLDKIKEQPTKKKPEPENIEKPQPSNTDDKQVADHCLIMFRAINEFEYHSMGEMAGSIAQFLISSHQREVKAIATAFDYDLDDVYEIFIAWNECGVYEKIISLEEGLETEKGKQDIITAVLIGIGIKFSWN